MTIASAQSFIQRTVNDYELIQRLNTAADSKAFDKILGENGFEFDSDEFYAAFTNVLTWCQTQQQADAVNEVKFWYDCLIQTFDDTRKEVIPMGCTPEQCAACGQKKTPEGCTPGEAKDCTCQEDKQEES